MPRGLKLVSQMSSYLFEEEYGECKYMKPSEVEALKKAMRAIGRASDRTAKQQRLGVPKLVKGSVRKTDIREFKSHLRVKGHGLSAFRNWPPVNGQVAFSLDVLHEEHPTLDGGSLCCSRPKMEHSKNYLRWGLISNWLEGLETCQQVFTLKPTKYQAPE